MTDATFANLLHMLTRFQYNVFLPGIGTCQGPAPGICQTSLPVPRLSYSAARPIKHKYN
jgi:hypothetical protein